MGPLYRKSEEDKEGGSTPYILTAMRPTSLQVVLGVGPDGGCGCGGGGGGMDRRQQRNGVYCCCGRRLSSSSGTKAGGLRGAVLMPWVLLVLLLVRANAVLGLGVVRKRAMMLNAQHMVR